MIIDTHCHYNLDPLHKNWRQHWQNAQEKGVIGSIVVGTSVETSRIALEITKTEQSLFPTVGIHPSECQRLKNIDQAIAGLYLLKENSHIIALGECGLDYYRLPDSAESESIKTLQKKVLLEQFKLAQESQLPLIIHLRDKSEQAYWDFLELYSSIFTTSHPFILHCVSGPLSFIEKCIDLGAYIGVAGNVTYNNSDHIRELIAAVPSGRVLVETDAPFLPPQVARGKICEPMMIQWTVEYLKQTYGLQHTDLVNNTVSLFPQFEKTYEAIRNS